MFYLTIRKNYFLLIFPLLFTSELILSLPLNNNNYYDELTTNYEKNSNSYNFFRGLSATCKATTYSKADIQEECDDGIASYERILKYSSYSNYISAHSYHSNGLNYVTSFFVDSDTHHFGNFMRDGVGMIILYIIDGLLLLGWIPLLICWKNRCCMFDECLYGDDCCIVFWHILTYFLAAAIFSFLLVVLIFGG
jgi:hypothetical protein